MPAETPPNPHAELPAEITAALARDYRRIVVFSGAGISAESGIPTFRSGSNGLWKEFDPADLATPEAFLRDPALVWAWYEWRRGLVLQAQPHAGHLAAARLQRDRGARIVTQNVDDLHERAGASEVLHLHGSMFAARCFDCDAPHALGAPPVDMRPRLPPPRCKECGGPVRPGVVWFGELLPEGPVREASALLRQCDLLLVVGTSGRVQPAAGLVHLVPDDATVIVVDPDGHLGGRSGRLHCTATAASALPRIADAVGGR